MRRQGLLQASGLRAAETAQRRTNCAVPVSRLFRNGVDVFCQTGNAAGSGAFMDDASFGGLGDNGFGLVKFNCGIITGGADSLYNRFYACFNAFVTQPAVFILAGTLYSGFMISQRYSSFQFLIANIKTNTYKLINNMSSDYFVFHQTAFIFCRGRCPVPPPDRLVL
jgi:hypothetical protein